MSTPEESTFPTISRYARGDGQPGPLFSVIIPTQGRSSLRNSVESILKQTYPDFELTVVTDGDEHLTLQHLSGVSDPRLRLISQPQSGVSAARNHGASHTSAPWIAFLDDDDTARSNWLATIAESIHPELQVITANLALNQNSSVREIRCSLDAADPTPAATGYFLAGGFVVRREIFTAVGGYDERLRYSENTDLGLRLCDELTVRNDKAVLHVNHVVGDIYIESSRSRVVRHNEAQRQAANLMLEKHAARFRLDKRSQASYFRVLARTHRVVGHHRVALRAALRACQIDWRNPKNWKALTAAIAPRLTR